VRKSIILSVLSIGMMLAACTSTTPQIETRLTGKVYYLDQNHMASPVEGALVVAKTFYTQIRTDASGAYSIVIEPTENEVQVELEASKVGYDVKTVSTYARKGETVEVPDITLEKLTGDSSIVPTDTVTVSGDASNIEVYGTPDAHIYIKESGLQQTALISFMVKDDKGVPVDENHKVMVHFEIMNGPGGGEYLFPETMETQNGSAYTVLNSGITAGVVQIQAWADVNGATIRALPIRMAIYGGLPDENHFSVVMEKANIAGRVNYGIIDHVTAFVGDKFSNPAAPGTAVYFSSNYAIVEGAAVTDDMGRATVSFMSASPLPPDPANNPFAIITAHTFTDTLGQKMISAQTDVLLSAATAPIQVNPTTFHYNDSNTPIHFNYTVSDVYGYPIVSESKISVSATDGTLYGDVDIDQRDTQSVGSGTTDFGFTWAPGDSLYSPEVYITITVTTPKDGNGYASTSVVGTKQ